MPGYSRQKRFPLAKLRRRIDSVLNELDQWTVRYTDKLGDSESIVLRNRLLERLGAIDNLWHKLSEAREFTREMSWH